MSLSDSSHCQVDVTHFELRCAFDLEPHSVLPHKVCVSGFSDGYVISSRRYLTSWQVTVYKRVGTLVVATIYLQLIQNRYMFRSFTVLHCSHQYCVQPVASDLEVVGYL